MSIKKEQYYLSIWQKVIDSLKASGNVSPEVLQSIERENARKQLAKARRTGQKLDNEKELLDIIKGRATNNSTKSAPVTKSEVNANSEITPDDIEALKKAWGLA